MSAPDDLICKLDWTASVMGIIQLHLSAQCGRCGLEAQMYELLDMNIGPDLRGSLLRALEKHAMIPCTLFSGRDRQLTPVLEAFRPRAPCMSMTARGWREWFRKIDTEPLVDTMAQGNLPFAQFVFLVETKAAKKVRMLKSPNFKTTEAELCMSPANWMQHLDEHFQSTTFLEGRHNEIIRADDLLKHIAA